MSDGALPVALLLEAGGLNTYGQELCEKFGLALLNAEPNHPFLRLGAALSLVQPNTKISPISVDFLAGKNQHRRLYGGGAGQMLCKAVGLKAGVRPNVLDMTAGLGQDAFVLASLGCTVHLQERSPFAGALLFDGLQRLANTDDALSKQLSFEYLDSRGAVAGQKYEVVYLDPMYPEHNQKAAVNKSMAVFRDLIGGDTDADELLAQAFTQASHRVVVKRPKKGRYLAGKAPSYQLVGKSSRYDIYTFKALGSD